MKRSWLLGRVGLWAAAAGGVLELALLSAAASAVEQPEPSFPRFSAEPCCDLCSRAADPSQYLDPSLDSYRMLVQGEAGWLFRTEQDLQTTFGPDQYGLGGLAALGHALAELGVSLVLVLTPTRGLMHADKLPADVAFDVDAARLSYRQALARIRGTGITVPALEDLVDRAGGKDYFFSGDRHWTPWGARRTADLVADSVRRLPAYGHIAKGEFRTVRAGLLAKTGSLNSAATLLCGFGAPKQYVTAYVTVGENGAAWAAADDLGGVVLVGTRNSEPEYNFAGFLAERLQTPVHNAALHSGAWDEPLLAYLSGPGFIRRPPAVLIWEVPGHHRLSNPTFYRRALARLEGGCEGNVPILADDLPLHEGRNELLFVGGGAGVRQIKSAGHLVDLRFSGIPMAHLNATLWYADGSRETMSLTAADPGSPDNRFTFRLRDDGVWGERIFLSMDIHMGSLSSPNARVQARLCKADDGRGDLQWQVQGGE